MDTSLVKKIVKKTKLIIKDNSNANKIMDILKYTQCKNIQVICLACKSLAEIFSHYISTKAILNTSKITAAEEDLSKEDQFSTWLKEQFGTTCDVLCEFLSHKNVEVQESSLAAIVTLLQSLFECNCDDISGHLIGNLITQLLSEDEDRSAIINCLPSDVSHWEKGTKFSSACLTHIKNQIKHNNELHTNVFLFNCWRLIKKVASYNMDNSTSRQLTGVICNFLSYKIPTELYRDILTGISPIMEKMSTPQRLTDFLSHSFDIGGAISLMSLHGLFILMHKHNLDYPDFYNKLYSMFEPQVFSAKYKARFFHLADTFLSSTHLPSYLVAAFVKRLARLSLHAPASAVYIIIPFIFNLINRHPALNVMLGRSDGPTELDSDPYMPDEKDPCKCNALESCLWELQVLERHYDPDLSLKASKRKTETETDLSTLLEATSTDIIGAYGKKIKKDNVPINFMKIGGLYLSDGFVL
ncbi:nucleolar complex protein 4 homolog [Physella acuta]|uniref:nucleolar complex protein 4 homolog n=1 Tax=Physella acuta TaxID=109671 RepID=UPI0027DCCF14|nr:nucleolar complex protein 4 homolog [Physella acuta]